MFRFHRTQASLDVGRSPQVTFGKAPARTTSWAELCKGGEYSLGWNLLKYKRLILELLSRLHLY